MNQGHAHSCFYLSGKKPVIVVSFVALYMECNKSSLVKIGLPKKALQIAYEGQYLSARFVIYTLEAEK